jgi:hypothetical protein
VLDDPSLNEPEKLEAMLRELHEPRDEKKS